MVQLVGAVLELHCPLDFDVKAHVRVDFLERLAKGWKRLVTLVRLVDSTKLGITTSFLYVVELYRQQKQYRFSARLPSFTSKTSKSIEDSPTLPKFLELGNIMYPIISVVYK